MPSIQSGCSNASTNAVGAAPARRASMRRLAAHLRFVALTATLVLGGRSLAFAVPCDDDADCAIGEACNTSTGVCQETGGPCDDDTDCAGGEACNTSPMAAPAGCIFVLNRTAGASLDLGGSASLNVPACGVVVNSSSSRAVRLSGTACLTAESISVSGNVDSSSPCPITPPPHLFSSR